MRLVDARRLRGPTLGASGPGAIAEIALEEGERPDVVIRAWRAALAGVLAWAGRGEVGRGLEVRRFDGGVALFIPSPVDGVDATLDLLEWSVGYVAERTKGKGSPAALRAASERFREALAAEASPGLVRLRAEAAERGIPSFVDDERVTFGHAARSHTYERRALPTAVPWRELGAIPVALVTGTNGKTTTTRMVARIAKHAGLVPGNTSSDGIAIGERIVERGDNTGGESARAVLRDPRVQIAILETARGGLLRRGLAVTDVDAALITNVSEDHLGEHGVLDLDTMRETKAVVGHAVKKGGKVVLGADDAGLRAMAKSFRAERVLFAIDPRSVRAHLRAGGHAFTVERGVLVHRGPKRREEIVRVVDVPVTDGGRALHNVKNALAAAALAWSLGLPTRAIAEGLRSFGEKRGDNEGRGQLALTDDGVRVLLDFGHNPAAATHLYAWARSLAGDARVLAVLTQPGDRTDAAIEAFVRSVVDAGARTIVAWERESLRRGREAGEVVRAITRAARQVARGVRVVHASDEADAIGRAVALAKRGDVIVVSPSLDRRLPISARRTRRA
ncbi:MAG: Mur ligase family protein [Sandaracinus sp.]